MPIVGENAANNWSSKFSPEEYRTSRRIEAVGLMPKSVATVQYGVSTFQREFVCKVQQSCKERRPHTVQHFGVVCCKLGPVRVLTFRSPLPSHPPPPSALPLAAARAAHPASKRHFAAPEIVQSEHQRRRAYLVIEALTKLSTDRQDRQCVRKHV